MVIQAFAADTTVRSAAAWDMGVVPVSIRVDHWAKAYTDQLSSRYAVDSVFKGKDLDAAASMQDFQSLVRLVFDKDYKGVPDSMSREAIVHEFTRLWAEKTGQKLDDIAVIKMLIYSDTDKIDAKYNHSITVAYMNNIARGVGAGLFNPKGGVTYGELAALAENTSKAIEKEAEPEVQPIVKGRLETRGGYEIKDGKVVFDFELMSHYEKPIGIKFGSGQQFELTITDDSGKEVYKYSDGKFFTMALIMKEINAGEAIKWQDEWNMTNKDGEKLTSGKYRAEVKVLLITEEGDEKIDESQLTKVIDFSL
jgi:hypothetical protein